MQTRIWSLRCLEEPKGRAHGVQVKWRSVAGQEANRRRSRGKVSQVRKKASNCDRNRLPVASSVAVQFFFADLRRYSSPPATKQTRIFGPQCLKCPKPPAQTRKWPPRCLQGPKPPVQTQNWHPRCLGVAWGQGYGASLHRSACPGAYGAGGHASLLTLLPHTLAPRLQHPIDDGDASYAKRGQNAFLQSLRRRQLRNNGRKRVTSVSGQGTKKGARGAL